MTKYLGYEDMTDEQRMGIINVVTTSADMGRAFLIPPHEWYVVRAVERPVTKSYRVVDKQVEEGDEYYDDINAHWMFATIDAPGKRRPVRVEQLDDYPC